ncbi:MAG: c-type cytochrome domain-containing protein [Planctomycetota bacterium]
MYRSKKLAACVWGAAASLVALYAAPTAAAEPTFATDVWPILEANCINCHGPDRKDSRGRLRKAKAGLRLDGKGHILAGSRATSTVVVPGDAAKSMLVQLISLPHDDEEIMPPKGEPLTKAQIATITKWIDSGADFGKWQGAAGGKVPAGAGAGEGPKTSLQKIYGEVGKGLEPLEAAQLQGVCGGLARVEAVLPGSPLLRVSFSSHEKEVTDDVLRGLVPLRGHVAHLDLGRVAITDKSLQLLASMPRLVRLDLQWTAVSGPGLVATLTPEPSAALWTQLISLNLNGTKTNDAALVPLQKLPKLQHLYIWDTPVTVEASDALRKARPKLRVRHQLRLPAPAPEGARDGPRRRNG